MRGLVIRDFDGRGVQLLSAGNFVEGNFIGTDQKGTAAAGNTNTGVYSEEVDNTIGGTAPGAGNLISANNCGIRITGPSGASNVVQGNLVGTDAAGTLDLGNVTYGVIPKWSPGNVIGGTTAAARNVVSGNDISGIRINQAESTGNLVQGNFVGTDVTGMSALGNTHAGIVVLNDAADNTIGGTAVGARNLTSDNDWGIVIWMGADRQLSWLGNFVGTDVNGTARRGQRRQRPPDRTGRREYRRRGVSQDPPTWFPGTPTTVWSSFTAPGEPCADNQIPRQPTSARIVTGSAAPRKSPNAGVHDPQRSSSNIDRRCGPPDLGQPHLGQQRRNQHPQSTGVHSRSSNEILGQPTSGPTSRESFALGNIGDGIDITRFILQCDRRDDPRGPQCHFEQQSRGDHPGLRCVRKPEHASDPEPGAGELHRDGRDGDGRPREHVPRRGGQGLRTTWSGVAFRRARNVISGNDGNGVLLRKIRGQPVTRCWAITSGSMSSGSVALGNTGYAGVRLADRRFLQYDRRNHSGRPQHHLGQYPGHAVRLRSPPPGSRGET